MKEATKGYFHDLNATRKYGGKTWIAPPKMIRQEVSTLNTLNDASSLKGSFRRPPSTFRILLGKLLTKETPPTRPTCVKERSP